MTPSFTPSFTAGLTPSAMVALQENSSADGVEDGGTSGGRPRERVAGAPLEADEINEAFNMLPTIGDMLTEVVAASARDDVGIDSSTVSMKMNDLRSKLAQAEALLESIPGGELSRDMQKRKLEELDRVLSKKRSFLQTFSI